MATERGEKKLRAAGEAAVPLKTAVWWGEVAFGAVKVDCDRLTRTATVAVMSYEEAGEL
ncbi:MAG: hypothetical protein ACRYFU_26400 [Janthinobacterium lividum]